MEYLGFIKEFDKNIRSGKNFSEMFSTENYSNTLRERIVSYLESGNFFGGAMSYIYDFDRQAIGNLNYYTDGTYIWPSYYIFYLKKFNNFVIDEQFITYLEDNNYEKKVVNKDRLKEIDALFINEWMGKHK